MFCKLKLPHLLMGLLLTALPSSAWALHLGGSSGHPAGAAYTTVAAEDIANTIHNLGDSITNYNNPNFDPTLTNPGEVCVFCHTPHGANTGAPGAAPLWNREVPLAASFTPYTSPNFDGLNSGQPQGVSLACLSCHDGSIALDALVNSPGSGGFNTLTPASGGLLTTAQAMLNADGSFDEVDRGSNANYELLTGATPFPNLTTNLSDDHPISMAIPATDPQFDELLASSPAADASGLRLLTRTGTVNLDKRDQLRAYPSADGRPAGFYVECASCHNPHAPRPVFLRLPNRPDGVALASGGDIIRIQDIIAGSTDATLIADNPNAASLICRSCHAK